MRNLLALVGAAVVGFGGVGWYLGWYTLKFSKAQDGNVQVQTTLDTNKVTQDLGDGAKRVGELINSQAEKASKEAAPVAPPAPAATPAPKASGGWLFTPIEVTPQSPATGKR